MAVDDQSGEEQLDPASGRIIGAGSNNLQRSIDTLARSVDALTQQMQQQKSSRSKSKTGNRSSKAKTTSISSSPDEGSGQGTTSVSPDGIGDHPKTSSTRARPANTFTQVDTRNSDGSDSFRRSRTMYDSEGQQVRSDDFSDERRADGSRRRTTSVSETTSGGEWNERQRTTTIGPLGEVSSSSRTTKRSASIPANGWDEDEFHTPSRFPPPAPIPSNASTSSNSKTPGGSSGSGGRGPNGGGGSTNNFFSGAQKIVDQITSYGKSQVAPSTSLDNYAQWAAMRLGATTGADGTDGSMVNTLRKAMFGSLDNNPTLWAKNAQDAVDAAQTATMNSGFANLTGSGAVNPMLAYYMGGVKDLSILNPTMSAATSATTMGTLTSGRGLYASMLYGYSPVLGQDGKVDRSSLGQFTDSVMRAAFGKTSVGAVNLAAALGQNGNLNKNIQAYVSTAGGGSSMVTQLENYMTGRNTAALHGISGTDFDQLLQQYEAGGSKGAAAQNTLKKAGISNSILQSQRTATAASTTTTNDMLDQFGPALKNANDALANFRIAIDKFLNLPGIKNIVGGGSAWASQFGGGASSFLGALGGSGIGSLFGTGTLANLLKGSGSSGLLGDAAGGAAGDVGAGGVLGSLGPAGLTLGGALLAGWGLSKFGQTDATGTPTKGEGIGQWAKDTFSWTGIKNTLNPFAPRVIPNPKAQHTTGNDGKAGGSSTSQSGGAVPSSGQAIVGKTASGAIQIGLSEIGHPYQWGGVGPNAFDCSGLMQYAYQHGSGVSLPRTSEQQMTVGAPVGSVKEALPGDLMFPNPGHVVMYLGGNKILEAPHTGADVRIAAVSEYSKYAAIRRIVGSVGSPVSAASGNTQTPQAGASGGGDSGSPAFTGDLYGSSEEADNVAAAIASVQGILNLQPMGTSASPASSTSSGASPVPGSLSSNAALGKQMAAAKGWTGSEWNALYALWMQESSWNANAVNPSSGAYGIPQALGHGHPYNLGDASAQIAWGLNYIRSRYGDPVKAEQHEKQYNWYNTGAWNIPQDQIALVHKGEMILEKPKADSIRNALMRDVVNMKDPTASASSAGSTGGVTLNFASGAVQFNVAGSLTPQQAQSAADEFARALASNDRMQKIGVGL